MSFDAVAFEKIEIQKRMLSRLLLQFQDGPVLNDILHVFGHEIQLLLNIIEGVVVERSPLDAVGEQLEGLGRIVGQSRIVVDYSEVTWFSPDVDGLSPDISPAWVEGVETAGSLIADDTMYRHLIEAKVYRNFAKYASVPENQQVAKLAFGVDVSYKITGPMSVDIFIPPNIPEAIINILSDVSSSGEDGVSIMPYPPTLIIGNIIYGPDPSFAPDTENTVDISKAAVFRPL